MKTFLITLLLCDALGAFFAVLLAVLHPALSRHFTAKRLCTVTLSAIILASLPLYLLIPPSLLPEKKAPIPQTPPLPGIIAETPSPAITPDEPIMAAPDAAPANRPMWRVNVWHIAFAVWFVGAVGYLSLVIISYIRYLRRVGKNARETEQTALLDALRDTLHITRRIGLYVSDGVTTPQLAGVFRPAIFLPPDGMPQDELRMTLLHELTHEKRHDLAAKWLITVITALHWYNPFIHLLSAWFGRQCEAACDETVTASMNDEDKKTYMRTIIHAIEQNSKG